MSSSIKKYLFIVGVRRTVNYLFDQGVRVALVVQEYNEYFLLAYRVESQLLHLNPKNYLHLYEEEQLMLVCNRNLNFKLRVKVRVSFGLSVGVLGSFGS